MSETVRGFEQASNYIHCSFCTPEKQATCELYQRGDAKTWCRWNNYGMDDICRCPKAKEILQREQRR
jgi:hypothetical protein